MLLLQGSLRPVGERSHALQPPRRYRRRVHSRSSQPGLGRVAVPGTSQGEGTCPPAAVRVPAAAFLSVPQCSQSVPARIDLTSGNGQAESQQARARIARRLLGMGVLREEDWTGEVNSSVDFGLLRWAAQEHGGKSLRIADFDVVYSENVSAFDFGRPEPYSVSCFTGVEPVGGFALRATGYSEIYAERAVRQWEQVVPGLGFALYDLLERALSCTVGVAGVSWVETRLEGEDWDVEEAEEAGYLTLDKFQKGLPPELFKLRWHPAYAEKALRKRKPPLSDAQKRVITNALELSEGVTAFRAGAALGDHLAYFDDTQQVYSIGARWNNADEMLRVIDDFHDNLMQDDWQTDICYIQCFQLGIEAGQAGSLESAITHLGAALDLLVRAERLLVALDGDPKPLPPQPKTPRKPKGKALAEIFGEGLAAEDTVALDERMRMLV